jgi:TonB family protein
VSRGSRRRPTPPFPGFALALLLLGCQLAAQDPAANDYDVPPKILKQPKPRYPDEAFQRRTEGIVLVEFEVSEKGLVESARVLEPVPGLNAAALDAVRKWRFAPARKDGKPVRTTAQAPVSFCIFRENCRALHEKK